MPKQPTTRADDRILEGHRPEGQRPSRVTNYWVSSADENGTILTMAAKKAHAMADTIAWGVYARNCAEVDAFASACVDCAADHTFGVALVDILRPRINVSADAADYNSWRCVGASHTFQSRQVLPSLPRNGKVPPSDLRFWPRTRTLFRYMLTAVPHA